MIRKYFLITMMLCSFSICRAQVYSFGTDTYIHCMDGGYGYTLFDAPLWVGTNRGLFGILGTSEYYDSLNSSLPSNYITAIDLHYSDNNLWVGTNHGFCKKGWANIWTCFNTANSGLPYDSITCILDADQDSIWIGTRNGLVLYLQAQDSFQLFNTANSLLPSNHITCIEKFSSEPFYHISFPLFIGTQSGLVCIRSDGWTAYDTSNSGLSNNHITAIASVDGSPNTNAWIATSGGGVSYLNSDTFANFTTSNNKIKSDTLHFIESLFNGYTVFTGNQFDSVYTFAPYNDSTFNTGWNSIAKPVLSASQSRGNGDWGWIGTDHDIHTFDFTEGIAEIEKLIQWKASFDKEMINLFNIPYLVGDIQLTIFDLYGRVITSNIFTNNPASSKSLPIPFLPYGVYIVNLQHTTFSQSICVFKSL